jgi:uncharacterized protein (TIGR03086 family)
VTTAQVADAEARAGAHDADMTDHDDTARADADHLMAIGRDREAVEAARAANGGGDATGAEQLGELMPQLYEVVAGITPDQLDAPTACASFTVQGVLEHMIGGASIFSPAFRGEEPPAAPSGPGADVLATWRSGMEELLAAVQSPGAGERTIASPLGTVPGDAFARYVVFDGLVHGWDLATATGRPYDPPARLVELASAYAHQVLAPEMRDGETFAAETEAPTDASPLERLVAFSGRRLPSERTPA